MRCDLHVHSIHSGMCTIPVLRHVCRECYNEPEALYDTLKHRGMDLVTITDHDSIGAVESLRSRPDFFLSEEVTCTTPSGCEFHMGVYDISERQHLELQSRREDFDSLIHYLREQRLVYSINHVFSSLTGRRTHDDFILFQELFPLVETKNGQMPEITNRFAVEFAERIRRAPMGGSDAHSMGSAGRTFTEVRGARTKEEFLAGLLAGHGIAAGDSGSIVKLTEAVMSIGVSMVREHAWTLLLAPLFLAVPLVTISNYLRERWFASYWKRAILSASTPSYAALSLDA